jgi:hypothetical protein
MRQLCSKEKSQRVKSHKLRKGNPFSPRIPPLPPIQYSTPPSSLPHLISQQAIHIKASGINWNWSKLVCHIKMKSQFSYMHVTRSTCSSNFICIHFVGNQAENRKCNLTKLMSTFKAQHMLHGLTLHLELSMDRLAAILVLCNKTPQTALRQQYSCLPTCKQQWTVKYRYGIQF